MRAMLHTVYLDIVWPATVLLLFISTPSCCFSVFSLSSLVLIVTRLFLLSLVPALLAAILHVSHVQAGVCTANSYTPCCYLLCLTCILLVVSKLML